MWTMKLVCACLLSFACALEARPADSVTNAVDLMRHLGPGGSVGVHFEMSVEVTRGTALPCTRSFYAKSSGCDVWLVDTVLWPKKTIQAGDILRVTGNTALMNGVVSADCRTIEVVGHVQPAPPRETTIGAVLQGKHPYQCVRTHGVVTDAFADDVDHQYVRLVISATAAEDGGSLSLAIPASSDTLAKAQALVGAEVAVTGVSTPATRGLRRIGRPELGLLSLSDVTVRRPPPDDPFDLPCVDDVERSDVSYIAGLGRCRTSGRVIAVWQGNSVLVRTDSNGVVKGLLAASDPPAFGDSVVLAGIPYTDLFHVNLRRAIWKKSGEGRAQAEKPVHVTPEGLLTDGAGNPEVKAEFHGKAISVTGTVISLPASNCDDGRIRLKCGGYTIAVDTSSVPDALAGLELGSTVTASGTCVVKTDRLRPDEPLPRIEEVFVVARTADDIVVVSRPPWWTPGRLMVLIAALFAALAAIMLWNVLLGRLAEKRGRELMRSRLSQESARLKVQERTRIAVELHDTIAQNLTGVSLELDSAEQLARKDLDGMLSHLGMAARTLQSCRNELRNCLWDLRSRALEEKDLNEAIRRTVSPLVSDVDLSIRFNVQRKCLTDDMAHVLMRIVRELVTNAVRHGGASSVKIAGSVDDDILGFSVCDNGRGFDPATRPGVLEGHFGLQGIRERLHQFDGEMQIESAPGQGAKVTVKLRLPNPATAGRHSNG